MLACPQYFIFWIVVFWAFIIFSWKCFHLFKTDLKPMQFTSKDVNFKTEYNIYIKYFLRGKSFLISYASTIHTYSVFLSIMDLLHYRLLQYSKCVGCWVKAYKSNLTVMPWIFKVKNEQKQKKFFPHHLLSFSIPTFTNRFPAVIF